MKGTKYVVREGKLVRKALVDAMSIPAIADREWKALGEQIGQYIQEQYLKNISERHFVGPDLLGLKP
jgi:hypothetical protein